MAATSAVRQAVEASGLPPEAIAGMAFYGIVALAERATTFWHPSYRT